MRIFRFYYWLHLWTTETYIKAADLETAKRIFAKKHNLKNIITIEEVKNG